MRLIDADLFEKEIKAVAQGQATSLMPDMVELSVETIVETLDEVPTAYDIDKVIEQLEDKVKEYDERIERRKGANFFDETERIKQFDERAWGIENAIEIVKGGGIDGNTNT